MGVKVMSSTDVVTESLQQVNNNNSLNSRNSVRQSDPVPEYPVKTVDVKVCGPLYADLRDKKIPGRTVTTVEDGIPVKIEYADTLYTIDLSGNEITSNSPTVLCLHGAPGSHRDFKYMIKHLQQTGHRVIAPNFPSKCLLSDGSFVSTSVGKQRHSFSR